MNPHALRAIWLLCETGRPDLEPKAARLARKHALDILRAEPRSERYRRRNLARCAQLAAKRLAAKREHVNRLRRAHRVRHRDLINAARRRWARGYMAAYMRAYRARKAAA